MTAFLKSTRLWGLLGTAVVLWFLVFVVFGKIDMSWIMPDTDRLARGLMYDWNNLPFFSVQKEPATYTTADGKIHTDGQYIYYTVPTRQFTPKELAQMGVTNSAAKPAPPNPQK